MAEEGPKQVKLTTEFTFEEKPFLGGMRDKRTDIIYHHAMTQTPFDVKSYPDNGICLNLIKTE